MFTLLVHVLYTFISCIHLYSCCAPSITPNSDNTMSLLLNKPTGDSIRDNTTINGFTVYEHCQLLKQLRTWRKNTDRKSWSNFWNFIKEDLQAKGIYPIDSNTPENCKKVTKTVENNNTGVKTKSSNVSTRIQKLKRKHNSKPLSKNIKIVATNKH